MKLVLTLALVSLVGSSTPAHAQYAPWGNSWSLYSPAQPAAVSSAPMYSAFDPSGSLRYKPVAQPAQMYNAFDPSGSLKYQPIPAANGSRFDRYGNYCGPFHTGGYPDNGTCGTYWQPPLDRMDTACRDHDYAYIRNGDEAWSRTETARAADEKLVDALEFDAGHNKVVGKVYKVEAKDKYRDYATKYFKTKLDYYYP